MRDDQVLREQLLALLKGGNAHMGLEEAVAEFPSKDYNHRPRQVKYTFWHLLEHIRMVQHDILEFVRDPNYVSPQWPEGYWPGENELANQDRWDQTIRGIQKDHAEILGMVGDTNTNLTAPLPHAPDYNLLREVLLVTDHMAYHLGEFAILRQVVGNWPGNRKY